MLADGTVVHDVNRLVLERSKGRGGRLILQIANEFVSQEIVLARVYDYERFVRAWEQRTQMALTMYHDPIQEDADAG
tara:strand:+ start:137 stop:367 length:231 start_codon:yes stop_codon:yes gene_type:complete